MGHGQLSVQINGVSSFQRWICTIIKLNCKVSLIQGCPHFRGLCHVLPGANFHYLTKKLIYTFTLEGVNCITIMLVVVNEEKCLNSLEIKRNQNMNSTVTEFSLTKFLKIHHHTFICPSYVFINKIPQIIRNQYQPAGSH